VIRDLRTDDQDAVRSLVLAGMRERWGDVYDPEANPDLDDIWATYVEAGAEVVVVERDGVIVATGTLRAEPDGRGRIVRMAVDGTHRRQGLGRSVVDELVRRAARKGLTEVVVLTDIPWASARALYEACGFAEVDRDATDVHYARDLRRGAADA